MDCERNADATFFRTNSEEPAVEFYSSPPQHHKQRMVRWVNVNVLIGAFFFNEHARGASAGSEPRTALVPRENKD
jgi:hypothetical protein